MTAFSLEVVPPPWLGKEPELAQGIPRRNTIPRCLLSTSPHPRPDSPAGSHRGWQTRVLSRWYSSSE
jgi:hypothetical protein